MAKELQSLRPSDVITKSKLARSGELDIKSAEMILVELVNEGILEMVFAVSCKNEDDAHVSLFYGLESLYKSKAKFCPYCDIGMDFDNIRVGFKRKK
ncbi:hypothetical protein ACWHAM_26155 [Paenibacillus terrae]